jgi:hypothetical protein
MVSPREVIASSDIQPTIVSAALPKWTSEAAKGKAGWLRSSASGGLPTKAGIASYGRQIQGWTRFLCCLKASIEYGIDLRKGSITPHHKELIATGPAAKN